MKVIDILNKIANGEKPRFKIDGDSIYHIDDDGFIFDEDYRKQVEWYIDKEWLNEEVEIIEEDKKIEKIEYITSDEDGDFTINGFAFDYEQKMQIVDKINEIIDKLNDLEK